LGTRGRLADFYQRTKNQKTRTKNLFICDSKKTLRDLITKAVETTRDAGELTFDTLPAFDVEAPKQADHGDLATNLALVLANQPCRVRTAHQTFNLNLELSGPLAKS
jgi:hypothetical protein